MHQEVYNDTTDFLACKRDRMTREWRFEELPDVEHEIVFAVLVFQPGVDLKQKNLLFRNFSAPAIGTFQMKMC